MTSKFFESFLVAGIGEELRPHNFKKNLLCGVKDLMLIKGNISALKESLLISPEYDSKIKFIRFMVLSEELNIHLAIQYSNPYHGQDMKALFGVELVRTEAETPSEKVTPTKGNLIRTIETENIASVDDLFK